MSLDGKVAFITGGAGGIGRASALKLAALGTKIVVTDLNEGGLEETVQLVQDAGGEAAYALCDVSRWNEVRAAVKFTVETFGGLDIGLNNAGVGGMLAPVDQLDEGSWDTTIDVNLKGVWLGMKYEIPEMLKRGGGSVINVASLAGLLGFRNNAVYAASKHGVIGLTKSVALEYAKQGIRVNAICPGFTETDMVNNMIEIAPQMERMVQRSSPMRRLGHVDEIADAVVYLAGDTSSFVNGHPLTLDGGASIQ